MWLSMFGATEVFRGKNVVWLFALQVQVVVWSLVLMQTKLKAFVWGNHVVLNMCGLFNAYMLKCWFVCTDAILAVNVINESTFAFAFYAHFSWLVHWIFNSRPFPFGFGLFSNISICCCGHRFGGNHCPDESGPPLWGF